MKKGVSLILSLALSLTLVSSVGAQAEKTTTVQTPEEYIHYLESTIQPGYSSKSISDSNIATNNEADTRRFIEQFKSLSEDKQEKFVEYINDPQLLKDVFSADTPEQKALVEEKYSGDLSIETVVSPDTALEQNDFVLDTTLSAIGVSTSAVGDTWSYTFHYDQAYTIFGLDFIKTGIYMEIQVTTVAPYTSQVTNVNYSYGALLQNYYPGANLTKTELAAYISADKYRATKIVTWQWNFLWKGLGLTVGTREQTLTGDKAGQGTFTDRVL